MSLNEPKTEWIRLVASPTDKALLEAITVRSGGDNLSATVRRLIRLEAQRMGLLTSTDDDETQAVPA